jgi:hypothetical protein
VCVYFSFVYVYIYIYHVIYILCISNVFSNDVMYSMK